MIVDVHAHTLPEGVRDWFATNRSIDLIMHPGMAPSGTPLSENAADVDGRLEMMEAAGVKRQVMALAPISAVLEENEATVVARLANEAHAEMEQGRLDRLRGYLSLPLPYLDASLREMERGFDDLGLSAVMVQCSYGTISIADERFETLWAELQRRRAVVMIHPSVTGLCSPLVTDYRLTPSVGPILEDTVVIAQLVARQIPVRYPDIRIIVPHLGGALPVCARRLNNQMLRVHPDLAEPPIDSLRRLWYDTVSHGSTAALLCACETFGVGRIVSGSDYPYLRHYGGYGAAFEHITEAGLEPGEAEAVLHGNAEDLFTIDKHD